MTGIFRALYPLLRLASLSIIAAVLIHPLAVRSQSLITINSSCSLANAIRSANQDRAFGDCTAGSGADTIILNGDIALSAELPPITSDITIDGGNYIISGENKFRVFDHHSGHLIITALAISNGIADDGGGIQTSANLTLTNVAVFDNTATNNGGGISCIGCTLDIKESLIFSNFVTSPDRGCGNGGGISFFHHHTAAIESSAIFSNSACGIGGGINFALSSGTLSIANTTIFDNIVEGIFSHGDNPPVTLEHVTITGNGNAGIAGGDFILKNSIVAGNDGVDCYYTVSFTQDSVNSIVREIGDCSSKINFLESDPMLAELPVSYPPVFPLLEGSPAIGAGDAAVCAAHPLDQLGFPRPATGCDLGAYNASTHDLSG